MPSTSSPRRSSSGPRLTSRRRLVAWLLAAALTPTAACAATPDKVDMHTLDLANTTHEQPVDPAGAKPGDTKFVEVEIAQVVNPGAAGLSFEVFFEPAGAPRRFLGTFSLFPADRPGTFIVP